MQSPYRRWIAASRTIPVARLPAVLCVKLALDRTRSRLVRRFRSTKCCSLLAVASAAAVVARESGSWLREGRSCPGKKLRSTSFVGSFCRNTFVRTIDALLRVSLLHLYLEYMHRSIVRLLISERQPRSSADAEIARHASRSVTPKCKTPHFPIAHKFFSVKNSRLQYNTI